MWYVVQVVAGKEQNILAKIERLVSKTFYKSCFAPRYETKKRYAGEWKTREDVLFPGYVFVDTKCPDLFRIELNKVPGTTKLLCSENEEGEKTFAPLTNDEKLLVSAFIGDDAHVMKMSEGIIEGDEIKIIKGPLMGYTGYVKKIDRHKRLAYLELPMFGRMLTIKAGLEIIKKS